jgi:luciferase family oxidoreductase group 1
MDTRRSNHRHPWAGVMGRGEEGLNSGLRLSVLDQSPIPAGSDAGHAFANTIDLARATDRFGYHRFWVAEHHNSDGLAGSAPEVLIGQIATATARIRVGSGGVMLSHYAPYKVAETFRTLGALFPGRIDLGIGRAPGSDQVTMYALAPNRQPVPVDAYPAMVQELIGFLDDDLDSENPFRGRVRAVPGSTTASPTVWMLSSSPGSAGFAAHFGRPLSYAHFFGAGDGVAIVDSYRRSYAPSASHPEPEVSIAVGVICAETDDEARALARSVEAWRAGGLRGPIPRPEELPEPGPLAVRPSSSGRPPMVVGSPATVRVGIEALAEEYRVEEVLVVTIVWDHEARVRSYELIAEEFGLDQSRSHSIGGHSIVG